MEVMKQTTVSEFLFLGLTDDPVLQPLTFYLFLAMYLVPIMGNLLIILAVISDSHLHTPMYFLLSSLSFIDICISTSIIPRMLTYIKTQNQAIIYRDCLAQVSFVLALAFLENFLLSAVAYDCYVAVCHPLRYTHLMSPHFCVLLVGFSLSVNTLDALFHTLLVLRLSYAVLEIPHFSCELAQIIKLACSDALLDTILINISASQVLGLQA